ncbi:MAG: hypothetical protein IKG27_00260 [Bacilli bacterium]|nr:hypothetical protein [Bacilli bacterium]
MNEKELKDKLVNAYKALSLDDQRNEFNKEIISIHVLINQMLSLYGERELREPYNYQSGEDSSLTESEVLVQNFSNIVDLKNNLLLLLNYLEPDEE